MYILRADFISKIYLCHILLIGTCLVQIKIFFSLKKDKVMNKVGSLTKSDGRFTYSNDKTEK